MVQIDTLISDRRLGPHTGAGLLDTRSSARCTNHGQYRPAGAGT